MKTSTLLERAREVLPGGVNSAARAFVGLEIDPIIVERGEGGTIFDVEGNAYIDFCQSWGALILGHSHPYIIEKVIETLRCGTSFGISTELECEIAEKIVEHYPSIEKGRFVSSGTEAVMTAIRLARAFRNRKKIITFKGCYHGHSDAMLANKSAGVFEENTLTLQYNDAAELEEVMQKNGEEIAAVIIEPIAANMGVVPASRDFLKLLRDLTLRYGALLIFDEVITGYRVGLSGAQGLYGISPDLTTLGKIVGGGLPAAFVGGRKKILDQLKPLGKVFQAGTLSGNPVAMRAGLETLKICEKEGFYECLEKTSKAFVHNIEGFSRVGSMMTLFFDVQNPRNFDEVNQMNRPRFNEFFRYLLKRGIYIPPSPYEAWFLSTAHSDKELDYTKKVIENFLN
ncbi:MAG: glutamate-1-semialdehyde 2,1-aminomutase [Simkaniaceae bacterium]